MTPHAPGRAWIIGLAIFALGWSTFLSHALAEPAVAQWPAAKGWGQEALLSASANVVAGDAGLSMVPPAPAVDVTPSVVASGLDTPWEMRFAPDGRLFVTERPGRVRVISNGQLSPVPVLTIAGTETISAEEGLQGMALDPAFSSNGYMYLYYTYYPSPGVMRNRVARYTIVGDAAVGDPVILVDGIPGNRFHNGGRIAFGPDGKLYIATGSADVDSAAQSLSSLAGKILRINPDGTIPADNPFPGSPVYSLGHRNPQGLAWNPLTGDLWATEHGPTGTPPYCCHDEVNIIRPGGNYGWPKYYAGLTNPTYAGLSVPDAIFPVWESGDGKWAPGGALFYTGDQLGGPWAGRLLFAGLGLANAGGRSVYRLGIGADNTTPTQIDSVLTNQFGRLRTIAQAPDGSLYVATSNRDGRGQPSAEDDRIIRLAPALDAAQQQASFTLEYDAGARRTAHWSGLSADADVPAGTSIAYSTSSSADGVGFSAPAEGVENTPDGRFLRVVVTMTSARAGAAPTLRGLAVDGEVTDDPPPVDAFCEGSVALVCRGFDTDAPGFTATGGAWSVGDGRYVLSSPNRTSGDAVKNRAVLGTSLTGDFTVSVRATPTPAATTSNDVAVIFGYANAANYWSLSLAENNSGGNHGVFRVVNNVPTQMADITAPGSRLTDGDTYLLRLERVGNRLRVYRDDVLILTTTQAGLPAAGRVGLGSINDAASFDDLSVTGRATPVPPGPCTGSVAALCEDFGAGPGDFVTSAGTWGVSGGRYRLTKPAAGGAGVLNRAIHAGTIEGDFTMSAVVAPTASSSTANDVALVFGYQSPTNYWFASLAENNAAGNHGLFRVLNGVTAQVVDFPNAFRITDGTSYDVRLERAGDVLRVFRDGELVATTTQATLPAAGLVGLGSINDPASFDDLVVTQP